MSFYLLFLVCLLAFCHSCLSCVLLIFLNSDIIWFISPFLLCVFFRNFLCGYHGAYIIHLMVMIIYFNTLIKTLLIYPPFYHFKQDYLLNDFCSKPHIITLVGATIFLQGDYHRFFFTNLSVFFYASPPSLASLPCPFILHITTREVHLTLNTIVIHLLITYQWFSIW